MSYGESDFEIPSCKAAKTACDNPLVEKNQVFIDYFVRLSRNDYYVMIIMIIDYFVGLSLTFHGISSSETGCLSVLFRG